MTFHLLSAEQGSRFSGFRRIGNLPGGTDSQCDIRINRAPKSTAWLYSRERLKLTMVPCNHPCNMSVIGAVEKP